MVWTILFAISIAQGLFLVFLIRLRGSKNLLASRLLIAMLAVMILTNFGYLTIRTDLINYVPQFFGAPFGMIFLLGPLFYFYCQSVMDQAFTWKKMYWLHFIPYGVQLLINLPILLANRGNWIQLVNTFLAGDLAIRKTEQIIFIIQDIHLLVYLILIFTWMQSAKANYENTHYIVSISSRLKWLKELTYCFSLFLMVVFSLFVFLVLTEKYNPVTNYVYTLISSCIIYFVAYKLVMNPELISPDFVQKYRAYMQFMGEDGEKYLQKLKSLMNDSKIFVNPELSLSSLAENLGLPSHQVSKLINEKFGKSFNDLVNEYRVQEFIARINNPTYQAYSVFGVALDVGFNSKSSFNSTFKRITGKTPTAFRKDV